MCFKRLQASAAGFAPGIRMAPRSARLGFAGVPLPLLPPGTRKQVSILNP